MIKTSGPLLKRDSLEALPRSPNHVHTNPARLCNVSQSSVSAVRGPSVYPEDNSLTPSAHMADALTHPWWVRDERAFAGVNDDPRRSSLMTATSTSPLGLDNAPTNHPRLLAWVREVAALTTPDEIVWVDGSDAEWQR